MDALFASYGSDSDSESDSFTSPSKPSPSKPSPPPPSPLSSSSVVLPPPPVSLLAPPNSTFEFEVNPPTRVRTFPHVEGNYALHVYIPVYIPQPARKLAAQLLKQVSKNVPDLRVVDVDIPVENLLNDSQKLEQIALGREFHISLGRTVPIRVHQIDSIVTMLRQKLQYQKRYWIDFNKWEVFVNDECTRAFLATEVTTGGLSEITKQIQAVNEVYRLHNLPEFYKDPRPHISLTWASGDASDLMQRVVKDTKKHLETGASFQNRVFTVKFSGIDCKIGNKTYKICKLPDE